MIFDLFKNKKLEVFIELLKDICDDFQLYSNEKYTIYGGKLNYNSKSFELKFIINGFMTMLKISRGNKSMNLFIDFRRFGRTVGRFDEREYFKRDHSECLDALNNITKETKIITDIEQLESVALKEQFGI